MSSPKTETPQEESEAKAEPQQEKQSPRGTQPSTASDSKPADQRPGTQEGPKRPTHASRWNDTQERATSSQSARFLPSSKRQRQLTPAEVTAMATRLAVPKKTPEKTEPAASPDSSNKDGTPKKKVFGCDARLAGTKTTEPIPLPPLAKSVHLSEEAFAKHIDSLYTAPILKHRKWEEKINQELATKPCKVLTMSDEEVKEKTDWLAKASVEQQRKKRQQLTEKYLSQQVHHPKGKKQFQGKEERQTTVARLYNKATEHEKEVSEKLTQMYSPPRSSPTKRTNQEWEGTIERLAAK